MRMSRRLRAITVADDEWALEREEEDTITTEEEEEEEQDAGAWAEEEDGAMKTMTMLTTLLTIGI